MERNPDYLLREVAGRLVLVPVGKATRDFPGMITTNETGKFLWEALEQHRELDALVEAVCDKYQVSQEQARKDVQHFVEIRQTVGAISK